VGIVLLVRYYFYCYDLWSKDNGKTNHIFIMNQSNDKGWGYGYVFKILKIKNG
jgi:hypothetical protein